MDSIHLQNQLEKLAQKLSVTLRYESIESEEVLFPGGLCRIKGEQVVIINSKAPSEEQLGALGRALMQFDLTGVYLRPAVRDFLEQMQVSR
ncbi:MAG TPA: hypothetical protein PLG17_01940 [Thermodesulfobacteriota bacterium]|nr:hypothetical protein [Deltaproteobacteria bacterium]HNR14459.1 hypothetical protein [Thermodesulfobacteriota bacterium]HNU70171.1 hypothetical protein [Thermodesulfobacteriota bacterium]HOC37776.1 hypothetical protein [Thermodesulfobacteriota bacterium]HQO77253.1 hypothetical protein [Thermodesulfobacteriota bacterium]